MSPPSPIAPTPTPGGILALRSEKVRGEHQERLAVVYVRQSTQQQVLEHQESTRLQYGLRTRAAQMGWPVERILVIDDDLGKSGSTAEGRTGFQRMVSEVTLGHVGLILGIEMSRLARSCKDWHQLLEACGLFGTLIADLDGVYDPAQYNDRLLLGLKGTMSEAELHILKQRMYEGRIAKARRGELGKRVPVGYVRRPSGEVTFDPDGQVQDVVRLIFRTFEQRRTLHAVLIELVRSEVNLGMRSPEKESNGEIIWRRPNRMTLRNILVNPMYAGAYAYGRRRSDGRRKHAGRAAPARPVARQDWISLHKDRFPAYISWEQYEANLTQLRANRSVADSRGAPRGGSALLSGIVVCGKCGLRMSVLYTGTSARPVYTCSRMTTLYGGAMCQSMAGPQIDTYVRDRVLEALAPASLDLSLEAARNIEQERKHATALWHSRLERAAYEASRAARQYRLVEPENRLVARQLEREWEVKLGEHRRLEEEFHRFEASSPGLLSELEREAIRRLAQDIPGLWDAATTTVQDRKDIVRQVVDRVVVDAEGSTERVHVKIHWAGGGESEGVAIRPVRKLEQLTYFQRLRERVRELAAAGTSAPEIAVRLNKEGLRPPKRSDHYRGDTVLTLMRRLRIDTRRSEALDASRVALPPDDWWLADLARHVPMPEITLYNWLRRGLLRARRGDGPRRPWVIWADAAEVARLRERYSRPWGYYTRARWVPEESAGKPAQPHAVTVDRATS